MQSAAPLAIYGRAAVTATAGAITATATKLNNGVTVKALAGNTQKCYVGDSGVTTANGFELSPGQEHLFRVVDASTLFVVGTASDNVCFEAS